MIANTKMCDYCDEDFEYSDDEISASCDIIDGQYVEYEVVQCPHCELLNKI